jgi:hypothetical protein
MEEAPDWGRLINDLVREIAHTEPSLLPALYRVNKGFHSALDGDNANAPYWKKYFYSVPGFSKYSLDPSSFPFPLGNRPLTWKDLVKIRPWLPFEYYLNIESPCWPCGNLVPGLFNMGMLCACGSQHSPGPITRWKPVLLALIEVRLPKADESDIGIHLLHETAHIGSTYSTIARSSYYLWNGPLQQINSVTYQRFPPHNKETTLVAALPKDIPLGQEWRVARFVGFV